MSEIWQQPLREVLLSPDLFDEGAEACRNACLGGASLAAAAITAAAYYSNPFTGLPALEDCMTRLASVGHDAQAWLRAFAPGVHPKSGDPNYAPGFGVTRGVHGARVLRSCREFVDQFGIHDGVTAAYLRHEPAVTALAGPLNGTGLCALTFVDHRVPFAEAARWFLLIRIEIGMREAQIAEPLGVTRFPFFVDRYVYEGPPAAPRPRATIEELDFDKLAREIGLDV